jgi:hypothetical protein
MFIHSHLISQSPLRVVAHVQQEIEDDRLRCCLAQVLLADGQFQLRIIHTAELTTKKARRIPSDVCRT